MFCACARRGQGRLRGKSKPAIQVLSSNIQWLAAWRPWAWQLLLYSELGAYVRNARNRKFEKPGRNSIFAEVPRDGVWMGNHGTYLVGRPALFLEGIRVPR